MTNFIILVFSKNVICKFYDNVLIDAEFFQNVLILVFLKYVIVKKRFLCIINE